MVKFIYSYFIHATVANVLYSRPHSHRVISVGDWKSALVLFLVLSKHLSIQHFFSAFMFIKIVTIQFQHLRWLIMINRLYSLSDRVIPQRSGTQTDSHGSHPTHGFGCVRLWVWGRPHPSSQLRVAKHFWKVTPCGTGIHGGHWGTTHGYWALQDIPVYSTGKKFFWT